MMMQRFMRSSSADHSPDQTNFQSVTFDYDDVDYDDDDYLSVIHVSK